MEKAATSRGFQIAIGTLLVVGMAFFFNASIHEIVDPPLFFPTETDELGNASSVLFLVALVSALVYLLLRSWGLIGRQDEMVVFLTCLSTETLLRCMLLVGVDSAALTEVLRLLHLLVLGPALVFLSTMWAGLCDLFDGRDLRMLIPLSMLLSIGFGVLTRYFSTVASVQISAIQSFYLTLSGLAGLLLGALLRHYSLDRNEPDAEEFHPTGLAQGPHFLGTAFVVLWVFIVGGSAFVCYHSHGLQLNVLSGSAQIFWVTLLAVIMLVVAQLSERNIISFRLMTVAFLVVCIVALYCAAVLYSAYPDAARSILLPARACAVFFSWLVLEEYTHERMVSFVSVACCFMPLVLGAKALTIVLWPVFDWAIQGGTDSVVLLTVLLATALMVTVGVFFVMRDSMGKLKSTDAPLLAKTAEPDPVQREEDALERVRLRYGLSNREAEILRLTMKGYTQKGMSAELYLSVNSISTYNKALHSKLGVHSRQEMVDLVRDEEGKE